MNVAIYLRVSSEQQANRELSIPAQREALQHFVTDRGWNIIEEYVDEAKTAKTADRPDFQRMIADSQRANRAFDTILVHKFDRFSRNRADHVVYKGLLKKHGLVVLSATEPTEPDTPHGMLLEGMLEVISEFYNVNLKHETMKGMKENAIQGFHCGGRAPFGYRLFKKGSKVNYELGPAAEVNIINQIFNMAAQGMGGKKITRLLNHQGIPIDRKWLPSTVLAILSNEAYLGYRVWNKKSEVNGRKNPPHEWIVTKNSHPAIVTEQLWNAAHECLAQRKINRSSESLS